MDTYIKIYLYGLKIGLYKFVNIYIKLKYHVIIGNLLII